MIAAGRILVSLSMPIAMASIRSRIRRYGYNPDRAAKPATNTLRAGPPVSWSRERAGGSNPLNGFRDRGKNAAEGCPQ
jgi:hypothetical protein